MVLCPVLVPLRIAPGVPATRRSWSVPVVRRPPPDARSPAKPGARRGIASTATFVEDVSIPSSGRFNTTAVSPDVLRQPANGLKVLRAPRNSIPAASSTVGRDGKRSLADSPNWRCFPASNSAAMFLLCMPSTHRTAIVANIRRARIYGSWSFVLVSSSSLASAVMNESLMTLKSLGLLRSPRICRSRRWMRLCFTPFPKSSSLYIGTIRRITYDVP